ncbi:single-stranded-DNA-specific exonuclease RecJ [Paenibacillus psychroresistens]|uniref:Single-stranded-DNA-specific exonuclease RecJ n=1 Tax=Paenibacillus psychroresistens TaxID=1778678 RepID=A0A6B8RHR4_9BACL|nr:single-stranded-DNA-specific exonuclease RecJ [Paenibacillus psychroresistens]QGQ95427.1 single-stranded-DNA-specific exonuclease RecJ [Paenibacillus psychroresistens]
MLQSKARWNIRQGDETIELQLVEALKISPLIAKLLVTRGIKTEVDARHFLGADEAHFHDPYLLDGMTEAVERIRKALTHNEKIRIYGDYDADGVSSTSLMVFLLKTLNANFDYYIPHRVNEGYGLNKNALELAKKSGVSLLITVDTGISATEEIDYANEIGLDVIVTDHHEPPELLPQAFAIINPKKPGCPYPFKQLAGVGVAFKLAHALLGRLPHELLEMATLGTIADLMPLQDENRLMVKLGLERLRSTALPGFKALLNVSGIERGAVTASHIGFSVAPRINASGRLDSADTAVRLLTTDNEQEAEHLAFDLDVLNKERQRIVEEMLTEALLMVEKDPNFHERKVIILAKEDWNVGVIGIVASKLLERYYRPTIIMGIDAKTGLAKGSARSIVGFDLYKALSESADLFLHYGGHQAAAGMTIQQDRIPELGRRLELLAEQWLSPEDFLPIMQADLVCDLKEMPLEMIQQLEQLAPYGMGNPSPRFIFRGLGIDEMKTMGREQQHLKLVLIESKGEAACSIEAIAFGKGTLSMLISSTAQVDVYGELSVNEWNGKRKPQLMMQDIQVQQSQLFDWRGTKDFEKRWTEVASRSLTAQSSAGMDKTKKSTVAIVVFDEAEKAKLPQALTMLGCSIWLADSSGNIQPLNSFARDSIYAQCKDVIYYFLPSSLKPLRISLSLATSAERIYTLFHDSDPTQHTAIPGRDLFKSVYGTIQQKPNMDMNSLSVSFSKRSGLTPPMIRFILDVFEELGLIEQIGQRYTCTLAPQKRELSTSERYQMRLQRQEVEQTLLYSSALDLSRWMLPQLAALLKDSIEAYA